MGRQDWRTPPSVFDALSKQFGAFDHDIAADDLNHLCDSYSTEARGQPDYRRWGKRNWGNIPFGSAQPFLTQAAMGLPYMDTVIITHANANSPWFQFALAHAALHCPDRRINYWHPDEDAKGADRDSVIWHFGGLPGRVFTIKLPEHRKEVLRLVAEASGQMTIGQLL